MGDEGRRLERFKKNKTRRKQRRQREEKEETQEGKKKSNIQKHFTVKLSSSLSVPT